MFLALFFATILFLIFLFRHCRQQDAEAEAEATASPTKVQSMTNTVYNAAGNL